MYVINHFKKSVLNLFLRVYAVHLSIRSSKSASQYTKESFSDHLGEFELRLRKFCDFDFDAKKVLVGAWARARRICVVNHSKKSVLNLFSEPNVDL